MEHNLAFVQSFSSSSFSQTFLNMSFICSYNWSAAFFCHFSGWLRCCRTTIIFDFTNYFYNFIYAWCFHICFSFLWSLLNFSPSPFLFLLSSCLDIFSHLSMIYVSSLINLISLLHKPYFISIYSSIFFIPW